MYRACISNVSYMCSVTFEENTCILTFHIILTMILTCKMYPKGVQDTFGIHVRYIKIHVHVSCALPWCHLGYISGYIRIRVS